MDPKKLAAEAQAIRYELGLNLREASKLTGLTKETISDVERARRRASAHTIKKLADGYGVSTRQLLRHEVQELTASGKAEAPDLLTEVDKERREAERQELEVVKGWVRARVHADDGAEPRVTHNTIIALDWIYESAIRDLDLKGDSEKDLEEWAGELAADITPKLSSTKEEEGVPEVRR